MGVVDVGGGTAPGALATAGLGGTGGDDVAHGPAPGVLVTPGLGGVGCGGGGGRTNLPLLRASCVIFFLAAYFPVFLVVTSTYRVGAPGGAVPPFKNPILRHWPRHSCTVALPTFPRQRWRPLLPLQFRRHVA